MIGYIPKEQRKRILLLSDDMRFNSGIATMAREIVVGTAHHFNWFNIGASANNHPDTGKLLDLSEDVNTQIGIVDADVKVLCNTGYGHHDLIMNILATANIDAIMIFTDPRYWVWLFQMENEVRRKVPIIYLNIWDDLPAPMYNKPYYESCDALLCISKQTKNIVEMVLGKSRGNRLVTYVPHGINEKTFFPITANNEQEWAKFQQFKVQITAGKEYDFIVLFNSRNINRKCLPTLILAFNEFSYKLDPEKRKKCLLVAHTDLVDGAGTDLGALTDALIDLDQVNVKFSIGKLTPPEMNYMYNLADVVCLPSSNEGWGLSMTEALMTGKMIIGNVTGGIQDQMRFEDENGKWIDFTPEFCSNHFGTYKKCGPWAEPVFSNNMCLIGSPPTPYIFDDRVDFRDLSESLYKVYNLGKEVRTENGLKGREWAVSDESGFTARIMCERVVRDINATLSTWKPKKPFELIAADIIKPERVPHPIMY